MSHLAPNTLTGTSGVATAGRSRRNLGIGRGISVRAPMVAESDTGTGQVKHKQRWDSRVAELKEQTWAGTNVIEEATDTAVARAAAAALN